MRQGGAGGWCCPFLARWRGPSVTGHAAHLCRVTFPFLAPSRPWPAKGKPLAVVLCSAHKEPPRSRQCRRHPGQRPGLCVPSPQPPGPAVPPARISPRGDELCMAHRPGPDFSYSRRGPRVWGGAKCPLIPHEPHRGRGTPQHFPCPFSASPDWGLRCESPWLPMPACIHLVPVSGGPWKTITRWLSPGREHSIPGGSPGAEPLGTAGTCWFLGS